MQIETTASAMSAAAAALRWLAVLLVAVAVARVNNSAAATEEHNGGTHARLGVALGQSAGVTSVAFSPDGTYVLTGNEDGTARLWEVASGQEVRRFAGHSNRVTSVAFSPDGTQVLTGSKDDTARVWDVDSGRELQRLAGESVGGVYSVAFSPHGSHVLTGNRTDARLYEVASGKEVRRFAPGGDIEVVVAFSPDGERVLTGHSLRDVATGQEVRRFPGSYVHGVAFSRDGAQLLIGGDPDKTARLFEVATGKEVQRFVGHSSHWVLSVAFSPDGKQVLTGGGDNTARLWDVATGHELRRFAGHAVNSSVGVPSVAFSPDGTRVLISGGDDTALLWDVASGKEVRRFAGHSVAVYSVAFSPDGRQVLTGGRDATARLWDLGEGKEVRRFADQLPAGLPGVVESVAFSPDGTHVLIGIYAVGLWEIASGKNVRYFDVGHAGCFSPDGKQVLTSNHLAAFLLDVASGKEVREFSDDRGFRARPVFSPDGSQVLTGGRDGIARLRDVATGKEVRRFAVHSGEVTSVALSSDAKHAVTASEKLNYGDGGGATVQLWEVASGRELQRFSEWVSSIAFSPDGKQVLVGSGDIAQLWEVASGKELRRFVGHSNIVSSVAFSPDGKQVLTGGADGTTRIWRTDTGEELVRLVSFDDGSWAVVDKEGRFDAPKAGANSHLYWIVGNKTIDLEQLKERYYEPGLLAKKLGLSKEPLRPVSAFIGAELYPEIAIRQRPSAQDPVLRASLRNRGGGIGRVIVKVNGKEVVADARPRGADVNVESLDVALPITAFAEWLAPGQDNRIEVLAYNGGNYLSSRGEVLVYHASGEAAAAPDIKLWALVVGISDYAGESIDLRYAAKDAHDMAAAVKLGATSLFGARQVEVRELTTLANPGSPNWPSKANIAAAFKQLAQRAGPEDVVLVYLAGHGVAYEDMYYYPTQEASSTRLEDATVRQARAISSQELADWLIKTKAQKQVIVLDTCAAGKAMASLSEARAVPGDTIRALDRLKDRSGVHVLLGSAADKASYEASRYQQGLLTYALLRGMQGPALREDQFVDVSKLFNYAADTVPELARGIGIQQPSIFTPKGQATSFDIGKLVAADRNKIVLRSPLPLVLEPTLIDSNLTDELELQPRLRAALREAAFAQARGAEKLGVVFVEAEAMPGAIKPRGQYTIDGDRLHAKLVLERDGAKKEVGLPGKKSDLQGFVQALLNAIMQTAGSWQ